MQTKFATNTFSFFSKGGKNCRVVSVRLSGPLPEAGSSSLEVNLPFQWGLTLYAAGYTGGAESDLCRFMCRLLLNHVYCATHFFPLILFSLKVLSFYHLFFCYLFLFDKFVIIVFWFCTFPPFPDRDRNASRLPYFLRIVVVLRGAWVWSRVSRNPAIENAHDSYIQNPKHNN